MLQELLRIDKTDRCKLERAIEIYGRFREYLLSYENDGDELSIQDREIIEQLLKKAPELKEEYEAHKEIESYLNKLGEEIRSPLNYFYKIEDKLLNIGSADIETARSNLSTLINPKEVPEAEFSEFVKNILHEGNEYSDYRSEHIAKILERDKSAFHPIFSHFVRDENGPDIWKKVKAAEIKRCLKDDCAQFYAFVNSEHRTIWIVTADFEKISNDNHLLSVWCQVEPSDHFIIVSSRLSSKEQVRAIRHECNRMLEESFLEIPTAAKSARTTDRTQDHNYASVQLGRNEETKRIGSRWIIQKLGVPSEATIIIDSGSNCYYYIDELFQDVENKDFWPHYNIITNNMLILKLRNEHQCFPQMGSISINLIGTRFDPNRQAFYRSVYDSDDMYENFRKSDRLNVLDSIIGTSCCFIEDGGLWLSVDEYLEREPKEFLWKLRCRRRIVLLDPSKVGVTRGNEKYDVFSVKGIYPSAPIILVSANPQNERERKHIKEIRASFKKEKAFHRNVKKQKLTIHLIIVEEKEHRQRADTIEEHNVEAISHDIISPRICDLLHSISKCKNEESRKKELEDELESEKRKLEKELFELV
jgi:hypothetical protein